MSDTPTRARRYWIEESDAGEFFEDYPEPGYNNCIPLVVDKAMIERASRVFSQAAYGDAYTWMSNWVRPYVKQMLLAALEVPDD